MQGCGGAIANPYIKYAGLEHVRMGRRAPVAQSRGREIERNGCGLTRCEMNFTKCFQFTHRARCAARLLVSIQLNHFIASDRGAVMDIHCYVESPICMKFIRVQLQIIDRKGGVAESIAKGIE